jgi:hypothetical protein
MHGALRGDGFGGAGSNLVADAQSLPESSRRISTIRDIVPFLSGLMHNPFISTVRNDLIVAG